MQDHVGFDHLFQGRRKAAPASSADRDEAHGVGQDDLGAVRQVDRPHGDRASRNSMSADSTLACVRRLNKVDLPALV